MWGSNSVYNLIRGDQLLTTQSEPPQQLLKQQQQSGPGEGSGDAAFALVINGVRIFSRGANLVPFELLEAMVNLSYINRTLRSVVAGQMNMLRVWGGGMYQADAFYDACDEMGILLYHDAMFCQRAYPTDDAFVSNVKAELAYQVQRLQSHASLVLWVSRP